MRLSWCSIVLVVVGACVPVQQGPGYQQGYAQPTQGAPQPAGDRQLTINGATPNATELANLQQLEASAGGRLPPGNYWYDPTSGLFGIWGGPSQLQIVAGLDLGPPVPANASGSGTQIVINGRVIHPREQQALESLVGPIVPGRYWLDAQGNAGPEGGPPTINLVRVAQQRRNTNHGGGGGNGNGNGRVYSVSGPPDATGTRPSFMSDGKCSVFQGSAGTVMSGC